MELLRKLGVLYWKVNGEEDPKLKAIRAVRGYSYKVDESCNMCMQQHMMPLMVVVDDMPLGTGRHHGVAGQAAKL